MPTDEDSSRKPDRSPAGEDAEHQRRRAEDARLAAETGRRDAETARQAAETTRVAADAARDAAIAAVRATGDSLVETLEHMQLVEELRRRRHQRERNEPESN